MDNRSVTGYTIIIMLPVRISMSVTMQRAQEGRWAAAYRHSRRYLDLNPHAGSEILNMNKASILNLFACMFDCMTACMKPSVSGVNE